MSRLLNLARRGPATFALFAALLAPGCSWFDWTRDPYSLSPSLEMGDNLQKQDVDPAMRTAVSNEAREIEDRTLSRRRAEILLP